MIICSTSTERVSMLGDLANSSDCDSGGWGHRNNRMAVGRPGNPERHTGIRENEKHARI